MAVQTTYALKMGTSYDGMLANVNASKHVVISRYNDEVSAAIPAGRGVCASSDTSEPSMGCKFGTADTDIFLGVAVHTYKEPNPGTYAITEMVPILKAGVVWVPVEEAVVYGDPVFMRIVAADTFTALGAFRKSESTTASSTVAVAGCMFVGSRVDGRAPMELALQGIPGAVTLTAS